MISTSHQYCLQVAKVDTSKKHHQYNVLSTLWLWWVFLRHAGSLKISIIHLMIFRVHQTTWGFWVHKKHSSAQKTHVISWTDIFNLIGSIKPHEVSSAVVGHFKKWTNTFLIHCCGSSTWGFFSCWGSLHKMN